MTTYTQLAVDNFQRANENPINPAHWTTGTGFVALAVVSNLCESPDSITFAKDAFAYYSGASFPADQYGEITLYNVAATSFVYVVCRTNALATGYSASISGPLGNPAGQIDLICENTQVTLGTWIGTLNVGDVVRVECVGTAISIKLNGTVIISATDANAVSGSVGVNLSPFGVIGDAVISLFAGGSISSVYSVPDDRNFSVFPNLPVNVQGTLTYTAEAHPSVTPPVDSRAEGAPVDSRKAENIPENSRAPGVFGPNE